MPKNYPLPLVEGQEEDQTCESSAQKIPRSFLLADSAYMSNSGKTEHINNKKAQLTQREARDSLGI